MSDHEVAGTTLDVAIVGAGVAGLYMLHRARQAGLKVRLFEGADGVGGTWYWNRYPGARVDIESFEYSYSFSDELQQDWSWTEAYAGQPELLRYLNHVADRFELWDDIQLSTWVNAAHFDDASGSWRIETSGGETISAQFCVMATGCLSAPKKPDVPGLDNFAGEQYFTSRWPHDPVDFTGKRVGVIGTGSSAIQCIPIIAQQAAHLTVFQRTANYSIPLRNRPMDANYERRMKARYGEIRAAQRQSFGAYVLVHGELQQPLMQPVLTVTPEERQSEFEYR